MANRLADATSPYLLQHADNPVDWWEWEPEAFEEARRRNVPVLLSVGYAACHWCHVMAHESFEDEATAAYLNEHFVSIKVDREERPDVDAVYMQATTSMTGHGGWPMTCVLDHDGNPFFAGTYFPDQPRHGQPSLPAGAGGARPTRGPTAPTRSSGVAAGSCASTWPRAAALAAVSRSTEADARRGGDLAGAGVRRGVGRVRQRAEVPAVDGARVPAPGAGRGRRGAMRMVGTTLEAMARGRHLRPARRRLRALLRRPRPGWCRTSRRCSTTTPSCSALYAAGGRTARRPGRPRDRATSCCASCATAEGGFASALDADTRGGRRARSTSGPPPSSSRCSVRTTAPGRPGCSTVTEAGTFEHGSSTLQLLRDPDDLARWRGRPMRRLLVDARAARVRPARDDKVVAAWNGLAITGLVEAGLLLGEPAYVDAAVAARRAAVAACTCVDGRLRRVSRDGVVGAHAGVLEDHGCVASRVPLPACGHRRRGLARPRAGAARRRARALRGRGRRLLRHRRRRRGAGGPAARPRRDNASPVRPLVGGARAARRTPPSPARAATATSPRRRCATVATLADRRRGSPAGRSPRPQTLLPTGRSRSRSSGPAGAERDALEPPARRHAPRRGGRRGRAGPATTSR